MAYNETLENRVREKLEHLDTVEEKRMMGGLVFMYNNKMLLGIMKDELMCRVDPELHEMLVEKNGCRTMEFSNRPMIGYILVEEQVLKRSKDVDYWIDLALQFNPKARASKKSK